MIHLLRLKNGETHELSQTERDSIVAVLSGVKEARPDFIEIKSIGLFVAISLIGSIDKLRLEATKPPSPEEELREFNERWERDNQDKTP